MCKKGAHGVVEAQVVVVQLQGERLRVDVVHYQVEDLVELRVFGIPQGAGALVAVVPDPQFHVRVHLAQQVPASRDVLHLEHLQSKSCSVCNLAQEMRSRRLAAAATLYRT